MSEIKDSGERTEFGTGALRDMHEGKGRFDLLPWNAIWEVSKHCEKGANKYGEHNVDKGIPIHSFVDSAVRHTMKFWLGWDDEPHLTAACWNLLWALEMMLTKPEMDDRLCKSKEDSRLIEMMSEEFERYDDYARGYNDAIRKMAKKLGE